MIPERVGSEKTVGSEDFGGVAGVLCVPSEFFRRVGQNMETPGDVTGSFLDKDIKVLNEPVNSDECVNMGNGVLPLDLSGADKIPILTKMEDKPSISNDQNEIGTTCDNQDENDALIHCPVLEEQLHVYKKRTKKSRRKFSVGMSEYKKRKRKKQRNNISSNNDVPPPDLIPHAEISMHCDPGPSSSTYIPFNTENKIACNLKVDENQEKTHLLRTPSPRKIPVLESIKPPGKRGHNGWEECLRPRPPQVEHFQSVMMMEIRKEQDQSRHRKNLRNVKRKLCFEEKLIKNKISRYLGPQSLSSEKLDDEIDEPLGRINTPKTVSENWQGKQTRQSFASSSLRTNQKFRLSSISKQSEQIQEESTNDFADDAIIGEIVWAKLGSTRWWPAMVVWGEDCGQAPAHNGQVWVFWFGDHKISELPNDKLIDFVNKFHSKYTDSSGKTFKRGVVEAITEIAVRALVHDLVADTELIQWAKQGFPSPSAKQNPYAPDPSNPYPESVRSHLTKIKDLYLQAIEADAKLALQQTRSTRQDQLENENSMLKKVWAGKTNIQDMCISCDSASAAVVYQHPLFEGGLCKNCKDEITDTMFAYGDDGTNAFCVICSNASILLICDNGECNRCYCMGCIEILVSVKAREKAEAANPWFCYLCDDTKEDFGLIKRKPDWQQNIVKMFQHETNIQIPDMDAYKEKKPIRVLSLFDGIGTCKLVLDQLGFEIDAYYASEIDLDAKNVVSMHYKDQVKHVGDIEQFTDNKVSKLCPIDLVVGGSPCNDLSLVNPARKGLYDPSGTGRLFFDFFRVFKAVQLANQGRHVFWLYENVASMPHEYRNTINRFLQVFIHPTPSALVEYEVEKIRTVTTKSNSLKQGKMSIFPVIMDGEEDVLWVTEIEKVFGFPKHYTDVGNLALGRRQQLLGKAWSVPVIKHLLTPLKNFFKSSPINLQVNIGVQTLNSTVQVIEQNENNENNENEPQVLNSEHVEIDESPPKLPPPLEGMSEISSSPTCVDAKTTEIDDDQPPNIDEMAPHLPITNHPKVSKSSDIQKDLEAIPSLIV
ncbi:DNA (cytosine-5)-methyltransferase 3A [Nymphon striatum]|nr:DNA (cytosine-5)-methyltransferase 3A [Nymphon striatum]